MSFSEEFQLDCINIRQGPPVAANVVALVTTVRLKYAPVWKHEDRCLQRLYGQV